MKQIDSAVAWARRIAANPAHGYSQEQRWGPDYDCSSFVISAWRAAGVELQCTYTGDMRGDMLRRGFEDVTDRVCLADGSALEAGDVLLNVRRHAALYIGGGRILQASINERGTVRGGESGDQTGREIAERGYYNYPWDCVLRYCANSAGSMRAATGYWPPRMLKYVGTETMPMGADVEAAQALLRCRGISLALDGEYGPEMRCAAAEFQSACGLPDSGVTDAATWKALLSEEKP